MTNEQAKEQFIYVPICKYNDEIGIKMGGYEDTFCTPKSFQATFNEYGMCFTYNNHKQGMDEHFYSTNAQGGFLNQNDVKFEVVGTKRNVLAPANSEEIHQDILKVAIIIIY